MRRTLFIVFLLVCAPVRAELVIESIQLQHRTAADVIGILQPMVGKNGSITGTGYKLFIKSTPENIAQLKSMIAQIDVAPLQLLVSVSLDRAVLQENRGSSARITVQGKPTLQAGNEPTPLDDNGQDEKNSRIKYDARLFEQAETERSPQVQTVRVTEGLWATIKTGQAIPIATRSRNPDGTVTETYTYTAVASGFQVLPRVQGNSVTLSIRPQVQSTTADAGGAYNTTELDTSVTGQLGQWIALGGVAETQTDNGTGITYRTSRRDQDTNQIYVKVERAPE